MATEIAEAYISVYANMPGVQRDIARQLGAVNGQVAGQGIGSSMGGGIISGLRSAVLGGAVAGIFASLTSSISGNLQELAAEAVTAADATVKFGGTLGFAGLNDSAIKELTASTREYADLTVYELGDIQNMTAQLASNGVKDFAKLAESAGNLNAVAGGNAETFKSVGMVMTQTAGQGKLTTENWNQLSDAIPGASGKIQEALLKAGAFTGNFREEMTKGEITAEEFNAAVMELGNQPVAVEAATSVKTFEGMVGNLEATIVGGLSDAFAMLAPTVGSIFEQLGNLAGPTLVAAAGGLRVLLDAASGLKSILFDGDFTGGLFGLFEDSNVVGVLFTIHDIAPAVGAAFMSIWDSIVSLGPVVWALVWALVEGLAPLGSMLLELGSGAFTIVAGAVAYLSGMLQGLVDWMPLITTALVGVTAGFLAYRTALIVSAVATGVVTLATNAYAFAQWAMVAAANAGAVAQRLLNAAMAANPIMLIVVAVGALVAALVWFFTQTELGQKLWQGFVDGIAAAWDWLWTTVLQPTFTAIGDAFTWLYENVITPIVDGIVLYVQMWAAIVTWLWENVLSPVFAAIGAIFAWLYDNVILPIVTGIVIYVKVWAAIFTWLWESVISPLFAAIGAIFSWIYNNVIIPIVTGIVMYFQIWGAIFTWLYEAVVLPIFGFIGAIFTWLYENVIIPIVNGVIAYFQAWGAVFTWIWESVILPTVNAIGAIFTWLYENVILPVWTGIQSAISVVADWITGTLWPGIQTTLSVMGAAFESFKETVAKAWDAIKLAAAAPINFVITEVYTKGIKNLFDTVAESVGISERMPTVETIAFAGGGVLPGRTPGRDVFDFISPNGGGHLRLGGGESIMVTEFADFFGRGGIAALNSAAKSGRLGDLFGGSQAFADGGIWSSVGATFAGAGDWLANVAGSVAQIVADPAAAIDKLIRDPVKSLLSTMGGGSFGDMFAKVPLTMVDKIGEWFATLIKPTTQGANGNWVGGNTLQRLLPYIEQTGTIITDTYRDPGYNASVGGSSTSYHMDAANPAVDVAGSESAMWAFYRLVAADPGGWRQILWQVAGHYDHVHVANQGGVYGHLPTQKYDSGGYLQPGFTLAYNGTGKPEPIRTHEQEEALQGRLGGVTLNQTNYMPIVDPNVVGDRLAAAAARGLVGVSA